MVSESCPFPALQRRISRIVGPGRAVARGVAVAFGDPAIDVTIGGGLARGRLHELFSLQDEEAASGAGFAAMLAVRAAGAAPMLWLRTEEAERRGGRLHAAGLGEIGVDPAAVVQVVVPDEAALLRAAADAARCAGLGALVIESWGRAPRYDLTASRRLMLATEGSGGDGAAASGGCRTGPQRRRDALVGRTRAVAAARGRSAGVAAVRRHAAAPARRPGGIALAAGVGS